MEIKDAKKNCIAIGGVGGSGTRLVASILKELNFYLGAPLNVSLDNLSFPKIRDLVYGTSSPSDNRDEVVKAVQDFCNEIRKKVGHSDSYQGWGWKVPGSFYYLDFFKLVEPEFKYIHVIRNGLDMAFSKNQNQLRNWGGILGIRYKEDEIHRASLDYWIKANSLAIKKSSNELNGRFHIVDFDVLCTNPEDEIRKLFGFLKIKDVSVEEKKRFVSLVQPPKTLNRHKLYDFKSIFENQQITKVKDFYAEVNAIRNK